MLAPPGVWSFFGILSRVSSNQVMKRKHVHVSFCEEKERETWIVMENNNCIFVLQASCSARNQTDFSLNYWGNDDLKPGQ